jgi:hypothetical protein
MSPCVANIRNFYLQSIGPPPSLSASVLCTLHPFEDLENPCDYDYCSPISFPSPEEFVGNSAFDYIVVGGDITGLVVITRYV